MAAVAADLSSRTARFVDTILAGARAFTRLATHAIFPCPLNLGALSRALSHKLRAHLTCGVEVKRLLIAHGLSAYTATYWVMIFVVEIIIGSTVQ